MIRYILVVLTACLIISGCSSNSVKQQTSTDIQPLVNAAWLNKKLPAEAYAYFRIPNSWSFFSAGDDSFAYAQGNKAHIEQIKQIQVAFEQVLEAELSANARPFVEILVTQAISPLEVMVYPVQGSAFPYLLASTQLNYDSAEQINPLLDDMAAQIPELTLVQPFDGSGYALLRTGAVDVILKFDVNSRTLVVFSGLGVSQRLLTEQLAGLENTQNIDFSEFENKVDSFGIGAIAWVNTQSVMPLITAFAPEQAHDLSKIGLADLHSVAMGMGTANGKGRLRFAINVGPESQLFAQTPSQIKQIDFKTVGEPKLVSLLRLPNKAQVEGILEQATAADPRSNVEIDKSLAKLNDIDIRPLDYFDNFGHAFLFKDDIGLFGAQHIRNKNEFQAYMTDYLANLKAGVASLDIDLPEAEQSYKTQIEQWVNSIALESRVIGDQEIHHLMVPNLMLNMMIHEGMDDHMPLAFVHLMGGGNEHVYWMIENDYVIFAEIPQLLVERTNHKKTHSIIDWQKDNGLIWDDSLLSIAGIYDGGKEKLYSEYLQVLAVLADSMGAQFDAFAFPTASELALNDPGVAGIQLDLSRQSLSLELTYEKTPIDALLMGNSGLLAPVAATGILAAVAIPAYQDYGIKADVSNIYLQSDEIQRDIAEYFVDEQSYPTAAALEDYYPTIDSEYVDSVEVEPDTGIITIYLFNKSQFWGETIVLTPEQDYVGGIYYQCYSSMLDKYLPRECQYY